jgi:dUTP pyrophosphatase
MKKFNINVKILHDDAILPNYAHIGDAGFDFHTLESYTLAPGAIVLVKTGLAMAIPEGFELQIRSRSGIALKKGVVVLNQPGTVDSGYRNEIGVMLHNVSINTITIEKGDRIAQGVINEVACANFKVVQELDETERQLDGFGSTGD